jgi:hypothetical protein
MNGNRIDFCSRSPCLSMVTELQWLRFQRQMLVLYRHVTY